MYPKKILVIRLRFLGDVVLTTPLVKALKNNFTGSYIAYLVEDKFKDALEGNPYLDEVITIKQKAGLSETIRLVRDLRKKNFDMVIDLFGNPRSAIITYLTGAKTRVGFNFPYRRKLYNLIVKDTTRKDAIEVYLNVLKNIGINSDVRGTVIGLSEESEKFADDFLAKNNIGKDEFIVGLNPGASYPAKRWGVEKFAKLSNELINKYNARIIIFEGYKEVGIAKKVSEGTVPLSVGLVGQASRLSEKIEQSPFIATILTIKQLASLIKRCSVFITNDAGPMHIAPAVGTPTIAIFGPGEPDIWFPYTDKNKFAAIQKKLECSPCHLDFCENHRCMEQITTEDVLKKIDDVMEDSVRFPKK